MNKYFKTFKAACKYAPKGSVILFDEAKNRIIVNPTKYDCIMIWNRHKKLKGGNDNDRR